MDLTIIGTGNMARCIATRALAGGHAVTLLGTETSKAEALAGELSGDASAGQVGDPLAGDVVVFAVWYAAVDDILSRYGDQLDGKVVVDITNPIDVDAFEPLKLQWCRRRSSEGPGIAGYFVLRGTFEKDPSTHSPGE